jgi:Mrp family chromosome partitioning ATPase
MADTPNDKGVGLATAPEGAEPIGGPDGPVPAGDAMDQDSAGRKRVRRTNAPTLAYLPTPADVLQRRNGLDVQGKGKIDPAKTLLGMVPVVTVSRSVSAKVTINRNPDPAPNPVPSSYSPPPQGQLVRAGAPGELQTLPVLPPPKINVERHALQARVDGRLILLTKPDSPQAACFRSLRHRVAERGDPRCILVTSASRGEGRTTCAANLALALAELRRYRVLLVEADPRRPSLASLFGLSPGTCFLDQLGGTRLEGDGVFDVVELEGRGLHVAALNPKSAAGRALDGPAFRTAVERLRRAYDYVVIDAPSVLSGPEVNLIEDAAQAIVLAARARQTRGRSLRTAIEQLTPSNLLGVVLLDG